MTVAQAAVLRHSAGPTAQRLASAASHGALPVRVHLAPRPHHATPPGRLVLFSVSVLPTRQNRIDADAFVAAHPGSVMLDATEAGRALAALALFAPDSPLTQEEAYAPWRIASERLMRAARGAVVAFVEGAHPRSTFVQSELGILASSLAFTTVNGIPRDAWIDAYLTRHPDLRAAMSHRLAA